MPLTASGEKMRKQFRREYGKRGDEVFYSYLNKHHSIAKKIERRRR